MLNALPSVLVLAALLTLPLTGTAQQEPASMMRLAQADQVDAARQSAAERAADMTGGKVLSAEPDTIDGKPVHRVKVLTPDGHVKTVVIEDGTR